MSLITHIFLHTLLGRTILGYILMFSVPGLLPVLFVTLIGVRGLRHLFSYEPRQSVMHAVDPRLKVLYPFVIGCVSVFLDWQFVYLLLAITCIPWLLVRTSSTRIRVVMTMIMTPAIGLVWSQGLYHIQDYLHPQLIFAFPATISWFGSPGLSASGLLFGVQQAGRVMSCASASLILLMTTTPSEVIWAFYKFKMPAPVGLAFTAGLRFLPQLIERMTTLLQVMQVRGYDLTVPHVWELHKWPGYIGRVFACIPIVTIPLLISSLRSTSTMAMVADARGFGSQPKRTTLHDHPVVRLDYVVLGVLVTLVVATIAIVGLHIGARQV
ncbi:energy-coupling factor transporter transmembrane protein EcfT [Ktedonobacteria bacterium brp13]|nr:energy-coupling factor transporter transmembrane protein EcfT [Ktedonobacteria bacterium brp13]